MNRTGRSRSFAWLLAFVSAACLPRVAPAATSEEVNRAIARAKAFLYSHEKQDNWEAVQQPEKKGSASVTGRQWGGLSSLALYALLAARENKQDPRIAAAIDWLKKATVHGDYAAGIRSQVWTFLPEKDARAASSADFQTLSKAVYTEGRQTGLYPYYIEDNGGRGPKGWADFSVSQYGVLGMWACEQAGQEIPGKYWETVDGAWKAGQNHDGGWPYQIGKESKATMTAAGVASLFITQDHLLSGHHWDPCIGGLRNENIERGLAYMDKHVSELLAGNYYGMYGVERIGVASGRKYFGTIDWYANGAEYLVRHQAADGSWPGKNGAIPDTAFAILFLVRGRAPVIMNKLEWSPITKDSRKPQADPWNERPRDVANFAHWSARQVEVDFNWQIVNLKVSANALHDAPILFISGSEPVAFDDPDIEKLRAFVFGGGMILANADCGSEAFANSFTALEKKLFPTYPLRVIPPNHPIYNNEQFLAKKWENKPQAMGASNGVRELAILVPQADLSRAWQVQADRTRATLYQLAQDIFLYASDKANLVDRGETYIIEADPNSKPTKQVKLARLLIGDNPDPEPGGWTRLVNLLHNRAGLGVEIIKADLSGQKLADCKIAHLTGTTRFALNADQRAQIKQFVSGGGTLIVDSAGGNADFADAAETELSAIFGGAAKDLGKVLPPDHPVFGIPGAKIDAFHYREYIRRTAVGKLDVPRIRAIEVSGRIGVFYSREDLSAGMVGEPVDGVIGYAPDTATQLMRNLVLYAAGVKSVAAPAPAQSTSTTPPAPTEKPHKKKKATTNKEFQPAA